MEKKMKEKNRKKERKRKEEEKRDDSRIKIKRGKRRRLEGG